MEKGVKGYRGGTGRTEVTPLFPRRQLEEMQEHQKRSRGARAQALTSPSFTGHVTLASPFACPDFSAPVCSMSHFSRISSGFLHVLNSEPDPMLDVFPSVSCASSPLWNIHLIRTHWLQCGFPGWLPPFPSDPSLCLSRGPVPSRGGRGGRSSGLSWAGRRPPRSCALP